MRPAREPFSFESQAAPAARPRRARTRLWVGLAAVLVAGVAGAAVYLNPGWVAPYLEGTPFALAPTTTVAYKWRDRNGSWQLTGTPPPAGTAFETLEVTSGQNIMPLAPDRD